MRFPIHREVHIFSFLLFFSYLSPKLIVILADDLAGGVFDLKRFYGAGGEEIQRFDVVYCIHNVVFICFKFHIECKVNKKE